MKGPLPNTARRRLLDLVQRVEDYARRQLRGVSNNINGSVVQVRGLLFLDGGAYRLVAGRIFGSGA